MRILLIEDDLNKAGQVTEFLKSDVPNADVTVRNSYQSGLKEIIISSFDLVLLDMQLPTFDVTSYSDAYHFRTFAGVDILEEVTRKKIKMHAIVITQFETFGEGEFYIDLKELKKQLKSKFPNNFIDLVYYNPGQSLWRQQLLTLIKTLK